MQENYVMSLNQMNGDVTLETKTFFSVVVSERIEDFIFAWLFALFLSAYSTALT